MATGLCKGRKDCTRVLSVLILMLLAAVWNRGVNGSSSIGGLAPPPPPSFPRIPGINEIVPPQIRNPSFCVVEDAIALLSFRAQLVDPTDALSSWKQPTDCCGWRGVTCSSSSSRWRRVTGLQLAVQGHETEASFLSLASRFLGVAGVPLSRLRSLESLSLTSVSFHTTLPSAWGMLSNLTSLLVINCAVTGEIPQAFARLHSLRHLHLSGNMLGGGLPPHMADVFRRLMTLDLSSNSFTGGIVLLFRSTLTSLDLAHNNFDDEIPDMFGSLPELRHLDLSHNRFRGSTPPSLQVLRHLQFIDLSSNELHGAIPEALFAIPSLTSVLLHDNRLSGAIPALSVPSSPIEELDLSNNELSGRIPPSIGTLALLQSLDLSGNSLTAGIPDTIALNTQLEFLFLENNSLEGVLPPELAVLSNLVLADVSHNALVGPIPERGPWSSFPASSFDGNLGLCGPPLKQCPSQFNALKTIGLSYYYS